jgi:hypothetical protein
MHRFGLFTAAGILAALFAAAVSAATLTTVSGADPYASCTAGGTPTSVVYPDAEVEPMIAVNPANADNFIGVWQQDRWSDGGARGLVAGYSRNGGTTWAQSTLPFTSCATAATTYERASDPWVSFGPDGTAYAVSISFDGSDNANAVLASTSTNGGKTWSDPKTLIADNAPNFQFFNDKESVTADPVTAGTAYAVWDRLEAPNGNPRASERTNAFTGPAMFSKTVDGGGTWSAPSVMVTTGSHRQTIGNQIVADPRTGTLYDFFDLLQPPNSRRENVAFVKSTNGGTTWSAPQIVASELTVGVVDPNTGQQIRTGDIIPEPAIDPATGRLYVVWQDSRFNGGHYDEVALSTSGDGGATWSVPIRVNTPKGKPAFTPAVAVNSNGVVGVTYYDFRGLGSETATLPTDYWFTRSTDDGATFGNERQLSGPFDMLTAPDSEGFFTGDYEGLVGSGGSFQPFFVDTNSSNTSNRTDVRTTTVGP